MNKDWRDDFEIVWHNTPPIQIESEVRSDIIKTLGEALGIPEKLITHTVFLGDDMDGPCVSVWGEVGDDRFHAEYLDKAEWVTLSEVDDV